METAIGGRLVAAVKEWRGGFSERFDGVELDGLVLIQPPGGVFVIYGVGGLPVSVVWWDGKGVENHALPSAVRRLWRAPREYRCTPDESGGLDWPGRTR